MDELAKCYQNVRGQIAVAERQIGRAPGSVTLLAVSKTKPASSLARLYHLGQRHFGENYLQEALRKQAELSAFAIDWHFIGPLQSNKTRPIAMSFNWVHSVDRLRIAERLSAQRPATLPPLNVCIQVNISHEATKSGVALAELPALVDAIAVLPRLRLRGVMAIPAPGLSDTEVSAAYRTMAAVVQTQGKPFMDTLSMGMSADLEVAVACGATIVRVGTALFGARG
ncbi:MAG: YggS family pyridoxal phosphate-dependent enzyme [Methylococcales bacterium]|nr:YggS family pyridoxal phosphate-dependent enzyme [Methylococcales bacterium]